MNQAPFEIDHSPSNGTTPVGEFKFNLYSWMRKVKPRATPGMGVEAPPPPPASVEEPAILSWDYTTPDDIQTATVARHSGAGVISVPVVIQAAHPSPEPAAKPARRRREKIASKALPAADG